jgi:hypothetical protein
MDFIQAIGILSIFINLFLLVGVFLLFKKLKTKRDLHMEINEKLEHVRSIQKEHNIDINKEINADLDRVQIDAAASTNLISEKVISESHLHTKSGYCVNHEAEFSDGVCAVSGYQYCKHCLKSLDSMRIGKDYLDVYLDNVWEEILIIQKKNIKDNHSDAIISYKKRLWNEEQVPVIVQDHFKINVISDTIESFTVLLSRAEDSSKLKENFSLILSDNLQ